MAKITKAHGEMTDFDILNPGFNFRDFPITRIEGYGKYVYIETRNFEKDQCYYQYTYLRDSLILDSKPPIDKK